MRTVTVSKTSYPLLYKVFDLIYYDIGGYASDRIQDLPARTEFVFSLSGSDLELFNKAESELTSAMKINRRLKLDFMIGEETRADRMIKRYGLQTADLVSERFFESNLHAEVITL